MNDYVYPIDIRIERPTSAKILNDAILSGLNKGYQEFLIDFDDTRTFSNVLVPIAGILDFYRNQNYKIECNIPPNSYIEKTHFDQPYLVDDLKSIGVIHTPLDRVWKFSSTSDINSIVDAVIKYIRQSDVIEKGVIESLEWCINETMDNVIQHSGIDYGYFMGQLHNVNKLFAFCIFDNGMGIYNSLKTSRYNPPTPYDAITLAMQERITRDDAVGQGNGLWGLSEIIHKSNGSMVISSGGAKYYYQNNEEHCSLYGEFHLGREHGTTLIDCQIDYSRSIDISSALSGYQPTDLWLDNLENENGDFEIIVAEQSSGTGTRKAASQLRNLVLNIVKNERKRCILDFAGINMISSSYADELIGKLIASMGLYNFMRMFELRNVNTNHVRIINRSVQQRMAQIYYDEHIDESTDY